MPQAKDCRAIRTQAQARDGVRRMAGLVWFNHVKLNAVERVPGILTVPLMTAKPDRQRKIEHGIIEVQFNPAQAKAGIYCFGNGAKAPEIGLLEDFVQKLVILGCADQSHYGKHYLKKQCTKLTAA